MNLEKRIFIICPVRGMQEPKHPGSVKKKLGWLSLAEKSLAKIWDTKKDDKTWEKYI